MPKSAHKPVVERIRKIALSLPETVEVEQFGSPFFKFRKKPFAVFAEEGSAQLSVKVEKASQPIFLEDPRFFKTAYVGKHGWVTLRIAAKPDWEEIEELIRGSYAFVKNTKKKQS